MGQMEDDEFSQQVIKLSVNNCQDSDTWLESNSQGEYGCHTLQFTNNLREKVCFYCCQRIPSTLEEIAFAVILENKEIFKRFYSTLSHLPQRICWFVGRALNANLLSSIWKLVGFLSEYGETQTSWFEVDRSKTVLLKRFRLYCDVYQKLKPYMTNGSVGIDSILSYLSNVDSTYEDFWSKMISAIRNLKVEADSEVFEPLKNIICAGENNVVLVKSMTESLKPRNSKEFETIRELQSLNKRFACPVVFKPTTIELYNPKSRFIPNMLLNFNPEVIVVVDIMKRDFSVGDIDNLGLALSVCNNLSSIKLMQIPRLNEVRENFAAALSRLLGHHHHLQKIGLLGFNLAGTLARYPLPPVDNLRLRRCGYTDEDLNFMANRSDLALKTLVVTSYCHHDTFPSLSIFIQNQTKSLKTVEFEYPEVSLTEICTLLRIMAKINELQEFTLNCTHEIDFVSIERIIVDFLSIHSARKFFLTIATTSDINGYEAEKSHVNEVVEEFCIRNRRPPIELLLAICYEDW